MSTIINATTANGVVIQPDNSGSLVLQTNNGTTAVTVDTSQNATFAGKVTSAGALTLASNGTTTAVTIDTSQNVGIGTTSPRFKLSVGATTSTSTATPDTIDLGGTFSSTAGTNPKLRVYWNGTGSYGLGVSSSQLDYIVPTSASHVWYGAGTERMRIDADGRLLVGITTFSTSTEGVAITPNSLNVTGNTSFNLAMYKASGAAQGAFLTMFWGGGLVGYINYNGSGVNYNTSSDVRLKKNIVDAPSAINLLNNVKVRSFDWISEDIHDDFGFVAQELYEVYPKAVTSQKDNEDGVMDMPWAVDYSKLVPVLTKAIQEQQTIINDLKARIETLEAK